MNLDRNTDRAGVAADDETDGTLVVAAASGA